MRTWTKLFKTVLVVVGVALACLVLAPQCALYAAEAAGEVVTITAPAATAQKTVLQTILDILGSPAFIVIIAGVVVKVIQYLQDKKGLDTDRWVGLVHNIYNMAESEGWTAKWSGHDKLAFAMDKFDETFVKTFGHEPTVQDRQDAKNDLAVLAKTDDHAEIAPGIPTPPKV
jgi:hypothetical protein